MSTRYYLEVYAHKDDDDCDIVVLTAKTDLGARRQTMKIVRDNDLMTNQIKLMYTGTHEGAYTGRLALNLRRRR